MGFGARAEFLLATGHGRIGSTSWEGGQPLNAIGMSSQGSRQPFRPSPGGRLLLAGGDQLRSLGIFDCDVDCRFSFPYAAKRTDAEQQSKRKIFSGVGRLRSPLFSLPSLPQITGFLFRRFCCFVKGSLTRDAASPLKRKFPAKSVTRNTDAPEPAVQYISPGTYAATKPPNNAAITANRTSARN